MIWMIFPLYFTTFWTDSNHLQVLFTFHLCCLFGPRLFLGVIGLPAVFQVDMSRDNLYIRSQEEIFKLKWFFKFVFFEEIFVGGWGGSGKEAKMFLVIIGGCSWFPDTYIIWYDIASFTYTYARWSDIEYCVSFC